MLGARKPVTALVVARRGEKLVVGAANRVRGGQWLEVLLSEAALKIDAPEAFCELVRQL